MTELFDLFPTPLMHVAGAITPEHAMALQQHFVAQPGTANQRSSALSHTRVFGPGDDAQLAGLVATLLPHVAAFGQQLFGQSLDWTIKELWANLLQTGGSQSVHNHANCFVSGVLYLSQSHPSARTAFVRALGGHEFSFRNTHEGSSVGPYTAQKWLAPQPEPGDLILFPSYLLHEVPPNQGGPRVSLAFNAIPHRLDAWGYAVSFQP